MDTSKGIERLPLEHPLPEEIQNMETDDTICQFCGVSYFIHREVKMLEEKVKAIEAELEQYKDYKDKFEKSQSVIQEQKQTESRLKEDVQKGESRIQELNTVVSDTNDAMRQNKIDLDSTQKQLSESSRLTSQLRERNKLLQDKLPSLLMAIQEQKSSLQNITTFHRELDTGMNTALQRVTIVVQLIAELSEEEIGRYKRKVEQLLVDKQNLEKGVAESSQIAKNVDSYRTNINKLEQDLQSRRLQEEQNNRKLAELKAILEVAQDKERSLLAEAAQFKSLFQSKTHELEEVAVQSKKQEEISKELITKLRHELEQKRNELDQNFEELNSMKIAASERQRQESELKQKARVSTDETAELKEMVVRVTGECEALKEERQMMIHSHQTRIEQLKESFKMKLAEADSWPRKMEDVMEKERSRHEDAMTDLERKLRETFQVELEIEQQICAEISKKERHSLSLAESKIKADFKSLIAKQQDEIERLKRKLETGSESSATAERSLREEVEKLKAIISDLEERLGILHSSQEDVSRNLKAELREAEDDLENSRKEIQRLKEMLEKGKEEVLVLQETVQRECEERLELTDALGQAKEQMLNLQRENSILSKAPPPMSSRSKSLSDDGFSKPPYMSSSPQPSPPDSRQNRSSSIALQSVSDQSESGLSQHQLQNSHKSSFTNSKEQKLFSKDTCDSLPEFTVQSSSNRKVKGSGKLKGSRRRVVPAKK